MRDMPTQSHNTQSDTHKLKSPFALSVKLSGGAHRTDVYELFPATFQVRPQHILTLHQLIVFVLLYSLRSVLKQLLFSY